MSEFQGIEGNIFIFPISALCAWRGPHRACFGFQHSIQRWELIFPPGEYKVKEGGVSNRGDDSENQKITCLKQGRGE